MSISLRRSTMDFFMSTFGLGVKGSQLVSTTTTNGRTWDVYWPPTTTGMQLMHLRNPRALCLQGGTVLQDPTSKAHWVKPWPGGENKGSKIWTPYLPGPGFIQEKLGIWICTTSHLKATPLSKEKTCSTTLKLGNCVDFKDFVPWYRRFPFSSIHLCAVLIRDLCRIFWIFPKSMCWTPLEVLHNNVRFKQAWP